MKTIILLLLATTASAEPIIVGPDGFVAYDDISYGMEWQSNQHLRVTFWHDPTPGYEATTYQAEERIQEKQLGDVWWYFLPFTGIDQCGRSQSDLEWMPGAGVHVVIDTGMLCAGASRLPSTPSVTITPKGGDEGKTSTPEPQPQTLVVESTPDPVLPQPIPEPGTFFLLLCGLCLTGVSRFVYSSL